MATIVQQTNGEKEIFKADEYTLVQQKFNDIYNTQLPGKANATDLATTNAQLADIAINPKQYGAKADGVTDDTQAIIDALNAHNTIMIAGGTFLVSQPITLKPGQTIKGDKSGTILISTGTSFNVFNLTYKNEVYGFNISQTNSSWAGNLFTVNSKTLQGNWSSSFVNLRIKIHDLYLEPCSGTFYEISCYAQDESGTTYTVYGMWNSKVYNINIKGYMEYFCRSYCYKPTGTTNSPWITVNEFQNIVADYLGYGWFGSKDTTTISDDQYFNYNFHVVNCVVQCYTNSKNFAVITGGTSQFYDCIPYDWGNQNTSKQNAFLLKNGTNYPAVQLNGTTAGYDLVNPTGNSDDDLIIANQIIQNEDGDTVQETTTSYYIGDPSGTTYPQYKRIAYFQPSVTVTSTHFRLHKEYDGSLYADYSLAYNMNTNTLTSHYISNTNSPELTFYSYKDANGYVSIYMVLQSSIISWFIEYDLPPIGTASKYFMYLSFKNMGNTLNTSGMTLCTPTLRNTFVSNVSQIQANSSSAGQLGYDSSKMLMAFGRDHYGAYYMPIVTTMNITATATSQTVTLSKPVWNLAPKIIIQPLGNVTTIPYPTAISTANQNFTANNLVSGQQYLVVAIYNEL